MQRKRSQSETKSIISLILLTFVWTSCTTSSNDETSNTYVNLQKQTVLSDGHPIAVWEKRIPDAKGVILFVHGRTWSALPDFDLQVEGEDLSLMDGMIEKGFSTYAVDLRGYGETPRDSTEWNTPIKAAYDILAVVEWIKVQENMKVHLFGWSMGSSLSLLATQLESKNLASLTLFGFWKDMDMMIPEDSVNVELLKITNTAEAAASDFIVDGSISDKAIDTYVKASLAADPVKVDWKNLDEYNMIDPRLIETPVLILQGEFDPIAPTPVQAKLFTRLKTANKSWTVIAGGDHAAHLEKSRDQFISVLTNFITRFN